MNTIEVEKRAISKHTAHALPPTSSQQFIELAKIRFCVDAEWSEKGNGFMSSFER